MPVNDLSPIYSDWKSDTSFLFTASEGNAQKLRFGGFNQKGEWKPWLTGG